MNSNPPNSKRRYSRKGCLQCKERKLKCDETKPSCLYCSKSERVCDYSRIAKFSDDRTFTTIKNDLKVSKPLVNRGKETRVSKMNGGKQRSKLIMVDEKSQVKRLNGDSVFEQLRNTDPGQVIHNQPEIETCQSNNHPTNDHNTNDNYKNNRHTNSPSYKQKSLDKGPTPPSGLPLEDFTFPDPSSVDSFNGMLECSDNYEDLFIDDVALLTHGLNDITTIGAFDVVPKEQDLFVANNRPPNQLNEDYEDKITGLISSYDVFPDHKNYLRLFNEKYSTWIFPFASGKKNVCYNTLMAQALKFPFLLNAILSVVARYENFCHANSTDEYYQKYYFVMCCRGFAKIFENRHQVVRYIEPLILTTLLLVTDSVAFSGGDWRAHLKAAHNLFVKYVDIYKRKTSSILLSTFWFATFEILAVVSNPLGGSLTDQKDFDIMMEAGVTSEDNQLSIEYGLVLPSGYNLFLGYSSEAISMFTTFAKIILPIKQRKADVVSTDDLRLLFTKIHEAGNYCLASKDCLVAKNNPFHPNNQTGMLLPIATYGYTNCHIFSWFDISHKVHVDALHLKILVDKHFLDLPETSPMVKALTKEIIQCCHFFLDIDFNKDDFNITEELSNCRNIRLWLDRRLLTVHWPLLTCGLYCHDTIDKLKIEFYFRCLIGMGARTLERSFEKLVNKWNGGPDEFDYVPFV